MQLPQLITNLDAFALTEGQTMIRLVNARGKSLQKLAARDGRDLQHAVEQYGRSEWAAWTDRDAYERSTHVIRKEQLLGLTAYVYRHDFGGGEVLESWYAPETGAVPIKSIVETPDGHAFITEATSIEFREVSDEEVTPRADLLWEFPQP